MIPNAILIQAPETWHREGLYMGMHWGWWIFWIALLLILGWAFWRLYAERSEARKESEDRVQAEKTLRQRFAQGAIDQDELARGLAGLQESRRTL